MRTKRRIRDIYPLTAMQQGMLVHALRAPGEPVYHQQYVLAISGVAEEDVLRQAIADLVARHIVLRTGFAWEGVDAPVQIVFAEATVPLTIVDGRNEPAEPVARALAAHRRERFDLRKPPLMRAHAVRVADDEWRLVTTMHHLVVDGWSMPTIQADLAELLTARIERRPPRLAPAAPFREFVTWLRANDNSGAAQQHFKRLLGDLRHPTPLGIDRVGRVSAEAGPAGRVVRFREVPDDRHPEPLARARGLLPSTIVHAAWGFLLATCADAPDAVFGTTVSGRPAELPGVTERVGMFVNTVPVRVSVDGELPIGPWLADVQEQLIAGREFEQTPVSVAQRCSGVPMGEPLYETVLGFQNYFRDDPGGTPAGPVTVRAVEQQEQTGLPLVVSVAFPPGAVWTRVEYDRGRIDEAVAEWIAEEYTTLLSEIAAAEDRTPLSSLSLADESEPVTAGDLPADLPFGQRVPIAHARSMRRVDRLGRPVPGPVPGEVVVTTGEGDVHTGLWARRRPEGTMELLGDRPGSHDWWIAARFAADPAVAQVVVDDGHAWIVSADGRDLDIPALTARLGKVVPRGLMPGEIHQVLRLPPTRAALRGATSTRHVPDRPLAERLAALPAARRSAFLDALRAAQHAVPPIRPGRYTGTPPRSVQEEFYDETTPLRPPHSHVEPAEGLTYADYAAWQRDDRRAGERDRQAAHWRTVLAGAPASGIPADRIAPGAPERGELTITVPVAGTRPDWLAAVAITLARCGRDDDVVFGVVTEPHLPGELTGVPGPFARMLPLRIPVGPDVSRREIARGAEKALDTARRNADVPWSVLRPMLAEDPMVSIAVHDTPGTLAPHAAATIGIDIAPSAHGTDITAVFDGTKVTERTVTDLLTRCAAVLEHDQPITAADLVSGAEHAELMALADGGSTADEPSTVHALVAGYAVRTPDAVAVQAIDGELTYRELVGKATALAGHLVANGVRFEDRVAVCLPRTSELVWVPLAVMMAGAAYVPVDPQYPEARIAVLCDGVSAVVTTDELATKFPEELTRIDPHDAHDGVLPDVRPDMAAYVMYTSGSTGKPKGVVVEHRSVVDFSRHIATAYSIEKDTRLLAFAAITFDVSVFDLWSALCAGATVVLAGDEERLSVDKLQRLLEDRKVTVAELPPSLMPLLDPGRLPDLRLVSVGGEAPAGGLVDDWATPAREFWNGYGPAETTVAVTLMRCEPPSGGRVPPIGKPMPNHRAYVLDERLRPVPIGVPGELCIAGTGLARGYLDNPGQTADRFVPDPFATAPGQRLYRTGDLVRWAPDGVLEFLGRVDRQVKIRGFRVELGEVETVLGADPRIRQVAVEVWDDGETKHLTAYVVPSGEAPTLAEVREIAAARLPDYMTPTRLAVLAALPRTPSGKVDRRALPAPAAPGGGAGSDEDWTPLERTIAAEVIGPLLRLSDVDREQDFFELGGNSLQATQVTSRVRDRFGVEIGLADFFAEPTVVRLASLVEQEQRRAAVREREVYGDKPATPTMKSGTVLPQSFPQMALYQAEEADGANPRYNAPFALRMRGPLDLGALRKAFASMLRRHPTLRVSLRRDGDNYVQQVRDDCDPPFVLSDVDGETIEDRLRTVRRLVREEGEGGFDLASGPLIRVRVHRLAQDDHVVQWTVHHLATDGWSIGVQLHEIGTAYHAYAQGSEPELEPLDGDYAEFVAWHREYVASPRYPEHIAWWRDQLRGASGIFLPTKAERAGHTYRPGYLNLRIEPDLAARVHALGKQVGTSLYMTTFAAYATVLAAFSGRDDIAVVTPNALRVRSAWERLVGWFVNRVIVRVRIEDGATFADLLRATRQASTAAFAHQAVPFESLRAELALPDDVLAACFSVQNAPMAGGAFRSSEFDMDVVGDDSGLDFTPIGEVYAPLRLRYESSVVLRQREDGAVAGGWEYDAALFPEDTARRWSSGFLAVLSRAAENPEVGVRELRTIAAETPPQQTVGWADS
ncbi:non-ribosomal peptide synthetase [Amycolatopsis taiwanensis]|uniref:non-ribosomal peptide synthetase n=1 Tax=Amycolatopsis taiwanensis TaxID=342230 RepID=UPI0004BA1598|nr:non-ribosomal peptide synthetase [Amycolatopsis taiwanensis]